MEKSIRIKFTAAAILSIVVLRIAAFGYMKGNVSVSGPSDGAFELSSAKHKLIFYDSKAFLNGVDYASRNKAEFPPDSKGGIIPHHLFPGFILSDFFSRLAKETPKRVIVIGPNHAEAGNYKLLSSKYAWETPYGTVLPDMDAIDKLADNGLIHINESVLENEHSVAGLMPYVKYYLPNAKVVPIILRGTLNDSEITRLGVAMGARQETFAGLSGIGDLITICISSYSRNRWFGEMLGSGKSAKDIVDQTEMVVEGVTTAKSAYELSKKYNVDMPITREVYEIIYNGKSPNDVVKDLMLRAAKPEVY